MFKSVYDLIHRHLKLSVFFIIFGILLFLNIIKPLSNAYYYDSDQYWKLSEEFVRSGSFSLLNYGSVLRGYLYPLIIYVIRKLASLISFSDIITFQLIMSLVHAIFLAILVPDLIRLLFNKKVKIYQTIVFGSLILFFWRGSFFYPLTDILAFIFLISGIYIVQKFCHKTTWIGLFPGLLWGGAAIIRPSYLITLPFLLIWAIYCYHLQINYFTKIILYKLAMIIVGLLIVFSPQLLINTTHFGVFSPFVQTQVDSTNLFLQQLNWGIVIQKYETSIDPDYPSPQVYFLDRQGESILIRSSVSPDTPISLGKYVELLFKYPLDFMSIYLRHIFNGLDIVYNTVYVNNVYDNALHMRLANYSLWFLVVIYIQKYFPNIKARKLLNSQLLLPIIIAMPSLVSIPTAIEVRFMIPISFMAYGLAAFWILPEFFEISLVEKKNMVFKYFVEYIIFVAFCFLLSSNTYMGLEFGSYVLGL